MTLLLKDPDAVLDYSIDWGTEYLGDDLLAASAWAVAPNEAGGVAIAGSGFDARISTVKASGGVAGHLYRLVNEVVTASGRTDSRSIVLRVEKR
jgi:long-subunit fatty acid transport protein